MATKKLQPTAEIAVTSRLDASPAAVWDRVISPEGINDEMRPWLRMTLPPGVERLDLETVELGKPIGRSWILLFGLIPFDYDDVTLVRLEPGRGFLERSTMLSQRLWEHERTIKPQRGRMRDLRPGAVGAPPGSAGQAAPPRNRLVLPSPPQAFAAVFRGGLETRVSPARAVQVLMQERSRG